MGEFSATWDMRFLDLAALVATWSKDPSTRVGAVIVRPNKTLAGIGYNGFPRGVADTNLEDREHKYARVVHAEMNAILNAGESVVGYTLYATLPPCDRCAAMIIQAGLAGVCANLPTDEQRSRWGDCFGVAEKLFEEAGVRYQVQTWAN